MIVEQSYSADVFSEIIARSNHKGKYLEGQFFPEVARINEDIKSCVSEIREKLKNRGENESLLESLNARKSGLQMQRNELLASKLLDISNKVVAENFRISLSRLNIINKKPIYTIDNSAESYFAVRRLQNIVCQCFDIKIANRNTIVRQLKCILEDEFPKLVFRTDIEEFYESINHESLERLICNENVLSYFSKNIIVELLDSYRRLAGTNTGIPRGVGISPYLAEIYMKPIDDSIRALPDVSYYARYVDDIVIVFTISDFGGYSNHKERIRSIIENHKLKMNDSKTDLVKLISPCKASLEYLGYNFRLQWPAEKRTIETTLTQRKLDKYMKRIDLAFRAYRRHQFANEKAARKLLIRRIRFLTGNTRLCNNKRFVLTGIYYCNDQLDDWKCLEKVDNYLRDKITSDMPSRLQKRLNEYSFVSGFKLRTFHRFTTKQLSEIMELWRFVK